MRKFVFVTALCFTFFLNHALACTDIRLTAKDGTVVVGRTLEFAQDLKSNIMTTPRGTAFNTMAPGGKPGTSWQAKYGYIFLDALNNGLTMDGMNDQGLSFEFLYLPGETQYQTVPAGQENQALPYFYFGDWVLGNFKSVDEVRQALGNVIVYAATLPQFGTMIYPVHAAIHDASGKGIIVEFVQGKMFVSENVIGVMTNSPVYSWQVTNLRNYVNFSPYSPNPVVVNGISFSATGQGTGMTGLPGDYSPPSRFVKSSVLLATAFKPANADDAVNLAEHIINNFDIALGVIRTKMPSGDVAESTQWTVFKDLTHKVFYYHTYNNLTLHAIHLDKINLAENAPRLKMPMADKPVILDVTEAFSKSNS